MINPFGIFFRFIFKSFKQCYSFLFVLYLLTLDINTTVSTVASDSKDNSFPSPRNRHREVVDTLV